MIDAFIEMYKYKEGRWVIHNILDSGAIFMISNQESGKRASAGGNIIYWNGHIPQGLIWQPPSILLFHELGHTVHGGGYMDHIDVGSGLPVGNIYRTNLYRKFLQENGTNVPYRYFYREKNGKIYDQYGCPI